MPYSLSRRDIVLAASLGWLWPGNWLRRRICLAEAEFREIQNGQDRRRYIWIHGDERTARDVLRQHMRETEGRAFLIDNQIRNVPIEGGLLDPNRMFSRAGAERNLSRLNPGWNFNQTRRVLDQLDEDRDKFLALVLPRRSGGLLIALHNNGPGYSVNDELPISDAIALNSPAHPREFLLCTMRSDYERLAYGKYNVVLQNTAPPEDDGSLSRLCAVRNVRYVNIEAARGNAAAQTEMLRWVEAVL